MIRHSALKNSPVCLYFVVYCIQLVLIFFSGVFLVFILFEISSYRLHFFLFLPDKMEIIIEYFIFVRAFHLKVLHQICSVSFDPKFCSL